MSTSTSTSSNGRRARNTASRFIANNPTSASTARPSTTVPPSCCQSQITSSIGKGICCLTSYLTISGSVLTSTGGGLKNRESPACPETQTATRSPATLFRERNCSKASLTISSGSASAWLRIFGYSIKSYLSAMTVSPSASMVQRSAFNAHCPISMPQTALDFAIFVYAYSLNRITHFDCTIERRIFSNELSQYTLNPGSSLTWFEAKLSSRKWS